MQIVFGIILLIAFIPMLLNPFAGLGTALVVLPIGCVVYRMITGKWPW